MRKLLLMIWKTITTTKLIHCCECNKFMLLGEDDVYMCQKCWDLHYAIKLCLHSVRIAGINIDMDGR